MTFVEESVHHLLHFREQCLQGWACKPILLQSAKVPKGSELYVIHVFVNPTACHFVFLFVVDLQAAAAGREFEDDSVIYEVEDRETGSVSKFYNFTGQALQAVLHNSSDRYKRCSLSVKGDLCVAKVSGHSAYSTVEPVKSERHLDGAKVSLFQRVYHNWESCIVHHCSSLRPMLLTPTDFCRCWTQWTLCRR
jgi:hypothetical protein